MSILHLVGSIPCSLMQDGQVDLSAEASDKNLSFDDLMWAKASQSHHMWSSVSVVFAAQLRQVSLVGLCCEDSRVG